MMEDANSEFESEQPPIDAKVDDYYMVILVL